ncbi:ovocalyxin-32 [Coturnix japonica]|uniref:ovocalyxin-32 n=1 Tax=Coturnix japonica TaxID=93934 RepID=UPI0007776351|nr:ovocalyxin-32 [Coturnix japonica]
MPGLQAALPAAFLLLLSSLPPASAGKRPQPVPPGDIHVLDPNNPQAARAAQVALQYENFDRASPHGLLRLLEVKKAAVKITTGSQKFYLYFTVVSYIYEEYIGSCISTVVFQKLAPPKVYSKCVLTQDEKQFHEKDKKFYESLRHRRKPIIVYNIPDSYGNIDRAHIALWGLAICGSSKIMFEHSREDLSYNVAQVKAVKQELRNDNAVEFQILVVFHETPTQNTKTCHLNLTWTIGQPLKEKHICTSDNHGLEDGSGQDSGSAAGMSHENERNFWE